MRFLFTIFVPVLLLLSTTCAFGDERLRSGDKRVTRGEDAPSFQSTNRARRSAGAAKTPVGSATEISTSSGLSSVLRRAAGAPAVNTPEHDIILDDNRYFTESGLWHGPDARAEVCPSWFVTAEAFLISHRQVAEAAQRLRWVGGRTSIFGASPLGVSLLP